MQIAINNKHITGYARVGNIVDGVEISANILPDDFYDNPTKYCYTPDKGIYPDPDYTDKTLEEYRTRKIQETKVKLAEWLENNPYLYKDGKYYSVTEEKQALLNGNLASYERATNAGIEYPLRWNSTGDECTAREYTDLLALSLSIAAYVAPKVSTQQNYELHIRACETIDEINNMVIDYD